MDGYTFPAYRRDRNKHGGGLIVFTKKDLITKRKKEFQSTDLKVICLELTVSKRKWIIFSVYRPPGSGNLANFFFELNKCVDMATRKYENIVIMGDINIDTDNDKAAGLQSVSWSLAEFRHNKIVQSPHENYFNVCRQHKEK